MQAVRRLTMAAHLRAKTVRAVSVAAEILEISIPRSFSSA
jgi:hypothetical protein